MFCTRAIGHAPIAKRPSFSEIEFDSHCHCHCRHCHYCCHCNCHCKRMRLPGSTGMVVPTTIARLPVLLQPCLLSPCILFLSLYLYSIYSRTLPIPYLHSVALPVVLPALPVLLRAALAGWCLPPRGRRNIRVRRAFWGELLLDSITCLSPNMPRTRRVYEL